MVIHKLSKALPKFESQLRSEIQGLNCYHRIHKRAREGEEVIPLAYLQDCHNYHEDFLDEQTGISSRKLNLDGNVDIYKNEQIVEDWLSQIKGFISN